ncbi:MAG TPA: hypothetical protein VGR55_11960 [Candidatus Acidoferrum sp.]|nr:hypothetical protein [Candidatus Acidoferrum sp.]
MFQYIDVVIAFVLLMLVASLFITAATQVVVGFLGLRGANLRRCLADLIETAYPDQETRHWAKEIAGRVLRDPTISGSIFSHFRLRADRLAFLPPETAGKLQGISASIPLLPWIAGGVGGFFVAPIALAMAKGMFGADICRYWDLLAGYVPAIDLCNHPWRTGLLAGAILGGLMSRWRLATSIRVQELPAVLEKLSEPLPGTLPDAAQRAMLTIAWSEKEPGAKPVPAAARESGPARSRPYFDEGIVARTSKASLQNQSLSASAEDFDEGIVRHAEPAETEGSVAVEVENAAAPAREAETEPAPATQGMLSASTPSEPRLEGLRAWFDHVMDRASQRFTVQARLVAVVVSCIFVFAAHFDAVRLLQSMSQGTEWRARLAATAEGIDKQAEQFAHSKPGARTVVPDVYRKAMVSVLHTVSATPEQATRNGQAAISTSQAVPETFASHEGSDAKPPVKRRGRAKEREKAAATAAPAEDPVTAGAKSKAMHDLEAVPGFASREEAELWLRTTLDGNPARDSLAAAYQQEVNAELVSDSDKVIDQSASLKSELARSQFKLFQDERGGPQSSGEVPSLLLTIALLSLGAAFWYNTLQNLASLRPQMAARQERRRKH